MASCSFRHHTQRSANKADTHLSFPAIDLVQSSKERVQHALNSSSASQHEDGKGAFSTIADAVASAGTAIGQLSSQILGGGEVSPVTMSGISSCCASVCQFCLLLNLHQSA